MATWATKRKSIYFFAVFAFVALAAGIPAFLVLYKAPTCFDGKQNGGERGVDCGGACVRLCAADYGQARVLWSYSSRVVPGVYNALAYVQNPNQAVEAVAVPYLFKLYDAQGILVAEKKGSAFIPAGQKLAIFEGGIQTGGRVPTRTTFEFTGSPEWRPGKVLTELRLMSVDVSQTAKPSAEAKVKNLSIDAGFGNVSAFIILYNKDDNRINFSKTLIDAIYPGETKTLYFTWPEAFSDEAVRSEVLFVASPR